MKNIIIGISSCVLVGLLILTVYTLHGRSIRQQELDCALASAMENVMERVREDTITSDEDMVALLLQEFMMQVDSNSQVTVHILEADYEKGLLSAEAIFTYPHPIGTTGKVSSRKTVIIESYDSAEPKVYYSVLYLVEGQSYKKYYVQEGSNMVIPGAPTLEGKRFVGWREPDGNEVLALVGMKVEKDSTFVAVFQ